MARLKASTFSVDVDERGNIGAIAFGKKSFEPALGYTLFEVNGIPADVERASAGGEGAFSLSAGERSGTLSFQPGEHLGLAVRLDDAEDRDKAGIAIPFPLDAVFHLPEAYNLARKIDADMPVGHEHSTPLKYNLLLVEVGGLWLRLHARDDTAFQRCNQASVQIARHPETFIATFIWTAGGTALLSVFASMEEAVEDYRKWLADELGIHPRSQRKSAPDWVGRVPMLFTVDMMRSHWEIAHDYDDVKNLVVDLKEAGCPEGTLFYLAGWNGAYDSTYPTYRPHDELGGKEKFQEMVRALHDCGYRVMVHTNPWGLDPAHPDIDRYLRHVVKDKDGKYAGFQTASRTRWGQAAPKARVLKFRTPRLPLDGNASADGGMVVETPKVPDQCEALVTIGGIGADNGRVRLTIGHRSMRSPEGGFGDDDAHTFEFPFLLKPGANSMRLKAEGTADWKGGWYRIHDCKVPPDPYATWTYPILFGDTHDPEWIRVFVDNITEAVEEYELDAIHCDATEYEWNKPVYVELRKRLPALPVCGEGFNTLSAMGYYAFCQAGSSQRLTGYLDPARGSTCQCGLPDISRMEEYTAWLNKESRVGDFVRDYIVVLPHLCPPDGFVPVGKVCNTSPPIQSPRCPRCLWGILLDARRLNCVPALRVNYRNYGLDEQTRKAVRKVPLFGTHRD